MAFRPNPAFRQELQTTPQYQAGFREITAGAAASVRAAAEPFRGTGYFIRHVKARGDRIVLGDPFWHLSEFGSIHNPPQGNVRRGLFAAGLRFEDHRAALT